MKVTIACSVGSHEYCTAMGAVLTEPLGHDRLKVLQECECPCDHKSSNGRIDDFESFDPGSNPGL